MKIIIIAALNKNRVIGMNGKIPWHIPEDLERFKQLTTHHTVVMGRKTFESIGKPLPERKNVVITRQPFISAGIVSFPSLETALSQLSSEEKIFIIGGGEIFQQTIDRADELMLTIVHNEDHGDTYFPPFEHLIGRKFLLTQDEKKNGYRFQKYSKSER